MVIEPDMCHIHRCVHPFEELLGVCSHHALKKFLGFCRINSMNPLRRLIGTMKSLRCKVVSLRAKTRPKVGSLMHLESLLRMGKEKENIIFDILGGKSLI